MNTTYDAHVSTTSTVYIDGPVAPILLPRWVNYAEVIEAGTTEDGLTYATWAAPDMDAAEPGTDDDLWNTVSIQDVDEEYDEDEEDWITPGEVVRRRMAEAVEAGTWVFGLTRQEHSMWSLFAYELQDCDDLDRVRETITITPEDSWPTTREEAFALAQSWAKTYETWVNGWVEVIGATVIDAQGLEVGEDCLGGCYSYDDEEYRHELATQVLDEALWHARKSE